LLPVTITDSPAAPIPTPTASSISAGTIQLQLPRGRLRIEGAVDPHSLRLVLECLLA
jgi:transposase